MIYSPGTSLSRRNRFVASCLYFVLECCAHQRKPELRSVAGSLGPVSRNTWSCVAWCLLFPLFRADEAYLAVVPSERKSVSHSAVYNSAAPTPPPPWTVLSPYRLPWPWNSPSIPFSRGSSRPRDWTLVSCIAGRFFIIWATMDLIAAPRYLFVDIWT